MVLYQVNNTVAAAGLNMVVERLVPLWTANWDSFDNNAVMVHGCYWLLLMVAAGSCWLLLVATGC